MFEKEQKEGWQELKEIWKKSSQTEKINFQISGLIDELKDWYKSPMISQFEKDSIKSDVITIKASWNQFKGKISQFEKDSINKDVTKITALVKKFLNLLRKIKTNNRRTNK